ncbi:hypothetical protein ACLIJR_04125 [Hydrogenophaga sp. XSHU_21]
MQRSSFDRLTLLSSPAAHHPWLTPVRPSGAPSRVLRQTTDPAADVAHVVVAGGPGGTAFTADDTHRLARRLPARVQHLQTCVSGSVLGGVSESTNQPVRQGLLDALGQRPDERALVILMAHTDIQNGQFHVCLDGTTWTPFDELFADIGLRHAAPVELFLVCCAGNEAIAHADRLPAGSVLVGLGDRDTGLHHDTIHRLVERLPRLGGINASGLLLSYCAQCLDVAHLPAVHLPDGSNVRVESLLERLRGRAFSVADRELVHEQLGRLVEPHQINASLALIESGGIIFANDLGLAAAVALVLGGVTTLNAEETADPDDPVPPGHVRLGPTQVELDPATDACKRMFTKRDRTIEIAPFVQRFWSRTENTCILQASGHSVELRYSGEPGSAGFRVEAVQGSRPAIDHLVKSGILKVRAPAQ